MVPWENAYFLTSNCSFKKYYYLMKILKIIIIFHNIWVEPTVNKYGHTGEKKLWRLPFRPKMALVKRSSNSPTHTCHVLTSHILTYPPLHFEVCRLESWHASVFGPLPSQSLSGFWSYPHSLGLAISALVYLDFAFRLPSSAWSFSWLHLYLVFALIQTI